MSLQEVDYFFHCGGGDGVGLQVTQIHLREALSQPFELTVDLVEEALTDLRSLLGKDAHLVVRRGALMRRIRGVVRRAIHMGTYRSRRHLRIEVVPTLWLLSQRHDFRIFQDMNALDIVREVLKDAGLYQATGALDTTQLDPTRFALREYCTQYDESDLDFVARLLADEGISYFFRSDALQETLVLVDDSPCDAFVEPVSPLGPVQIMGEGGTTSERETVRTFQSELRLCPTGVTLRDWDFTRPFDPKLGSPGREASMTRNVPSHSTERHVYEYPARAVFHGYDPSTLHYTHDDLTRRAQLRHGEHTERTFRCMGTSNVTGMAVGRQLHLIDEEGSKLESYTVTEVEHHGRVAEGGHDLHADDHARYGNQFTGTTSLSVIRPRRPPRPIVHGPQTAVVVAREGSTEDIDIDDYGRVLVRFHWERPERRADIQRTKNASCRIRVAQPWAGSDWGVVFNPRVGMEVVVQFLDGDPDRPLITGAVYNQHHHPPPQGDIVQRRTRTTLRTSSSPGGAGFNELSFEDEAGAEEIFLRAQRDLRERVLRNHSTTVHGHQTLHVYGDQTVHVHGVQRVSVDGQHGEPGRHGTLDVTGDLTITSTHEIALKAPSKITFDVRGTKVTLTPGRINLCTGPGGAEIAMNGDEITFAATKVYTQAKEIYALGEHVTVDGSSKVKIASPGPTTVSGTPLQLNGPGPFAGRVMELAPATITTGAALVLVGGPSFPFPVTRNADGSISVGDNLKILPGTDPAFQNMVLRDLGIMASTPSGLQRLNNIQNNPGGHDVVIREYNATDAEQWGRNNSIATVTGTVLHAFAQYDASGNIIPNSGTSTEIAYNPNIVLGPNGTPEPPDATLFHELGHAEHNAYGINRAQESLGGGWDNWEERQTIHDGVNNPNGTNDIAGVPRSPAENDYLHDRNYPYRRTDHHGGYANPDGSPITP